MKFRCCLLMLFLIVIVGLAPATTTARARVKSITPNRSRKLSIAEEQLRQQLFLANLFQSRRKYSQAIQVYQEIADKKSWLQGKGGYLYQVGRIYQLQGKLQQAVKIFNRIIQGHQVMLSEIAAELVKLKSTSTDEKTLEKEEMRLKVKGWRDIDRARFALAYINQQHEAYAKAQKFYQEIVATSPSVDSQNQADFALATQFKSQGKYDQAQACYQQILKRGIKKGGLLVRNQAEIPMTDRDSFSDMKNTSIAAMDKEVVLSEVADTYELQHKYSQAAQAYQELIKNGKVSFRHLPYLFLAARLYEKIPQVTEAIASYQKIIDLDEKTRQKRLKFFATKLKKGAKVPSFPPSMLAQLAQQEIEKLQQKNNNQ